MHPDSANINVRINFIRSFNNSFVLVEALDNKDFYKFSKEFDKMNSSNFCNILYKLFIKLFNGKTSIKIWFNESGVKKKRSESDKNLVHPIDRKELFWNLCKALEQAEYKSISVYESMKEIRNIKRRVSRSKD